MIVRLVLALLLALGAAPVAAMPAGCHDAVMAPMTMPAAHGTRQDRQPAIADHRCVGCAALPDWLAERIAAPPTIAATSPRPPAIAFRLGTAGPPRLPPPRVG